MTTVAINRRLPDDLPRNPAALFQRLKQLPGCFWLDSGHAGSRHGNYHCLGAAPDTVLSGPRESAWDYLRRLPSGISNERPPQIPAAHWVGYLSYDVGGTLEALPTTIKVNDAPDVYLARYPATVTLNSATGDAQITGVDTDAIEHLIDRLRNCNTEIVTSPSALSHPESQWGYERYRSAVQTAQQYIAQGDVYQVNLSHRFETEFKSSTASSAADMYLRMRRAHSAPYGSFLALTQTSVPTSIVSNSPEGFLDIDLRSPQGRVATWPLKGTRPITGCPNELFGSAKDRAEHVMIVDLERNDLGRIARTGTVQVSKLMQIVQLPTVFHLESCVEAIPRDDVTLTEIFQACFPGGSITGAPKVRAMQIIAELEREHRSVYCGALGYLDFDSRRSRWAIPIRTAVVEGKRVSFRSGSGIVADSKASEEWQETLDKSVALAAAVSGP